MASQITSLTVVYSTVYSDADQRKHQSSASLAFVWGIHRDRWIPRTKGQLRGRCFHLMTSSWRPFFKTNLKNSRVPFQLYFKWLRFQVFWEAANIYQHNSESSRSQGLRVLFQTFWGGTYKIHVRYQAKYGERSVYLITQYLSKRT